jgi:hypothetical protein
MGVSGQRHAPAALYPPWKGCGRKWSWSNLRYYLRIFLEGIRKTTKYLRIAVSAPRFETGASTIGDRGVDHSIKTFGFYLLLDCRTDSMVIS